MLSGSTNVQITCTIASITTVPTIDWKEGSNDLTSGSDYDVVAVTKNGNIATAVLTVKKSSTVDTEYTCLVTSLEWAKTGDPLTVNLNVYGM